MDGGGWLNSHEITEASQRNDEPNSILLVTSQDLKAAPSFLRYHLLELLAPCVGLNQSYSQVLPLTTTMRLAVGWAEYIYIYYIYNDCYYYCYYYHCHYHYHYYYYYYYYYYFAPSLKASAQVESILHPQKLTNSSPEKCTISTGNASTPTIFRGHSLVFRGVNHLFLLKTSEA